MAIAISQCLPHKIYRRDSKENKSFKEAGERSNLTLIKECSQSQGNYKRLVKLYEDYPAELIAFLQYAKKKAASLYRYVNCATSHKNWQKTLKDWSINIVRATNVKRYAPEIIRRLGIKDVTQQKIIRAICYRLGKWALHIAASIQDKGGIRNKFAYYLWRTSSNVIKQLAEERRLWRAQPSTEQLV